MSTSSKKKRGPAKDAANTTTSQKRARTEPAPASSTSDADTQGDSDVEEVELAEGAKKTAKAQFLAKYDTKKLSDEKILELQDSKWKSKVYDHFIRPPALVVADDGEVHYKFVCKTNPNATPLLRVRWDTSTGNLMRHKDRCNAKVAPADKGINAYAHGSTYSKARMRYLCAVWVARHHRPYTIVQDDELLDIFRMLYARVEVPHPTTLSRDVREIFELTRDGIAKELQAYDGRLHVCIDGWTSPNVISFLGVTVHRVVDGKMKSLILDFIKLIKGHTGIYLAQELRACFKRFGIDLKILAVVADNASNNNVVVVELESLGGMNSALTRVRCFAHILNLVVKAIIIIFAQKPKKSDTKSTANTTDDTEDVNEEDSDLESDAGVDDDAALSDVESEEEEEDNTTKSKTNGPDDDEEYEVDEAREDAEEADIEEIIKDVTSKLSEADRTKGQYAVTKLVSLAKRIFHSPTMREDLKACCKAVNIAPKMMKRAVATRWNSLADAIQRALYLRLALDKLLHLTKYDKSKQAGGLRRFRLSDDEWKILTQLYTVLKIFLLATKRISKTDVPLLHQVIPIIDLLTTNLTDTIANEDIEPVVRTAAARGLAVLNKYYSATDDSIMYRVAMREFILLHQGKPLFRIRHKLGVSMDNRHTTDLMNITHS